MDSLDALLADLQSTTLHSQGGQQQQSHVPAVSADDGELSPPPIDPYSTSYFGPELGSDGIRQNEERLSELIDPYETVSFRTPNVNGDGVAGNFYTEEPRHTPPRAFPSTSTVTAVPSSLSSSVSTDVTYSTVNPELRTPRAAAVPTEQRVDAQRVSSASTDSEGPPPPPVPPHPSEDILSSFHESEGMPVGSMISSESASQWSSRDGPSTVPVGGLNLPPPPAIALSANLNELDMLLNDLNSAQFMSDVESNSSSLSRSVSRDCQPSTLPSKPGSQPRLLTSNSQGQLSSGSPAKPDAPKGTSAATRELDDLMASLSEFKVTTPPADGSSEAPADLEKVSGGSGTLPVPPTPHSELDNMLGDLETDMSRQGINTTAKGMCAACKKPISGQVITALGHIWHPEHFRCVHCHEELGTRTFFEREGKSYCENDYHNLFSPRCARCSGAIFDRCVTAVDKTWHTDCFWCAHCKRLLGDEGFHEKDGSAYCTADYLDLFAPKCGACAEPIMENYISALNKHWHPTCFVCQECGIDFGGGTSFFDHEGMPYCETHYHAKRGSLCASCQKPITGRCITAMFRKFHPEHFVCAFCLKQLNKGTFKEHNAKPYCHSCSVKLFG